MIKVTLPYPPSMNRYWRHVRGRVVLSSEAKSYKEEVRRIILPLLDSSPIPDAGVKLRIDVYRPRKSGDLDNTLKAILDSMTGLLYVDDRQVISILANRFDDKENPRAEIEVSYVGD